MNRKNNNSTRTIRTASLGSVSDLIKLFSTDMGRGRGKTSPNKGRVAEGKKNIKSFVSDFVLNKKLAKETGMTVSDDEEASSQGGEDIVKPSEAQEAREDGSEGSVSMGDDDAFTDAASQVITAEASRQKLPTVEAEKKRVRSPDGSDSGSSSVISPQNKARKILEAGEDGALDQVRQLTKLLQEQASRHTVLEGIVMALRSEVTTLQTTQARMEVDLAGQNGAASIAAEAMDVAIAARAEATEANDRMNKIQGEVNDLSARMTRIDLESNRRMETMQKEAKDVKETARIVNQALQEAKAGGAITEDTRSACGLYLVGLTHLRQQMGMHWNTDPFVVIMTLFEYLGIIHTYNTVIIADRDKGRLEARNAIIYFHTYQHKRQAEFALRTHFVQERMRNVFVRDSFPTERLEEVRGLLAYAEELRKDSQIVRHRIINRKGVPILQVIEKEGEAYKDCTPSNIMREEAMRRKEERRQQEEQPRQQRNRQQQQGTQQQQQQQGQQQQQQQQQYQQHQRGQAEGGGPQGPQPSAGPQASSGPGAKNTADNNCNSNGTQQETTTGGSQNPPRPQQTTLASYMPQQWGGGNSRWGHHSRDEPSNSRGGGPQRREEDTRWEVEGGEAAWHWR